MKLPAGYRCGAVDQVVFKKSSAHPAGKVDFPSGTALRIGELWRRRWVAIF
jgi:hypothetical protein